MCGIVGGIANTCVVPTLLTGLQRLEYRGYDSAGLSVFTHTEPTQLARARTQGKVAQLANNLQQTPMTGQCGIAHTRWATHGAPSENNAHPHFSHDSIAVVHNGIIENHQPLRTRLRKAGYPFLSETDTEAAAHLLHAHMQTHDALLPALHATLAELKGAYALGILSKSHPDTLIAVRHGSPLVIGCSKDGHYLASDMGALYGVADEFIFLEDGDCAFLSQKDVRIFDAQQKQVHRERHPFTSHAQEEMDKGAFRHFMEQEIFAQPKALQRTMHDWDAHRDDLATLFGARAPALFQQCEHIHIVACGTSFHAGLVAQYWLHELAHLPTHVFIASEYRYQTIPVPPNTLLISLSQSGETADTLAAIRQAKTQPYLGQLAICNVAHATLVRETDLHFITQAGREIGVAATKTFTCQLVALLGLTLALAQQHTQDHTDIHAIQTALQQLPEQMASVLALNDALAETAKAFRDAQHTLFLGRHHCWPIALEGALKLKEIAYVHAEAYAAGELKHGPLALIDQHMPVIILAPESPLSDKLKANMEEIQAREGLVHLFGSEAVAWPSPMHSFCPLPACHPQLVPILYTLPMQLLSYHIAVLKGTDVDQPRNLAKSVTVE